MTLPSRMFRDPLQVLIDKENAIENRLKRMQRMQSFIMGRERREDYRQLRSRVESGAQRAIVRNSRNSNRERRVGAFSFDRGAEWQRRYEVYTGYPRRSCGMDAGGQVVTEESSDEQQEEAKWQRCAIVDRCIDDLPVPAQRAAVIGDTCLRCIRCAIILRHSPRPWRCFWWLSGAKGILA